MERERLLEKYLQDMLTQAEHQQFDVLLKSDPSFKKEVDFHLDVKRAVNADEDENFKNMLSDFESEARAGELRTPQTKEQKQKKLAIKWLVAASVAVLVGLSYFFFTNQAADPQDLFAQNFKPYPNVTHPITRSEGATDVKTKAFLAYAKGEYEESIDLFTALYTSMKEPYYLFYKANALIQLKRPSEAVPLLLEHRDTQDSLTDKSNWYLAMAYLQLKDTQKAKQALKIVMEAKAYKAEEAKQLIDAL